MLQEKIVKRNLAIILIITWGIVLILALSGFEAAIFGAVILFTLFRPLQKFLVNHNIPRSISAIAVMLVSVITVVVPTVLAIITIGNTVYNFIQANADQIAKIPSEITNLNSSDSKFAHILDINIFNNFTIRQAVSGIQINYGEYAQKLANWIQDILTNTGKSLASLLLQIVVMYFIFFYLLVDMEKYKRAIYEFSPFNRKNTDRLIQEFNVMTQSGLVGAIAVAIVQGASLGVSFLWAGVPNPFFWGSLAMIFALIPVLGAVVIWLIAAIIAFVTGDIKAAIIIVSWNMIVTSNIDNFMRAYVNKKLGNIHPLVSILGIFIGIPLFGIFGLVLGPALLSFFLLFVAMFKEEFVSGEPVSLIGKLKDKVLPQTKN